MDSAIQDLTNLIQSRDKTRSEILLASKYEELDLEHFSASSMNLWRQNRMSWFLRYILHKRSLYPAPSMYRGSAIERAIQEAFTGSSKGSISDRAKKYTKFDVIKAILKIYPVLPNEWVGQESDVRNFFSGLNDEKFVEAVKTIFETLPKLNPGVFEWIQGEVNYLKIVKKIEKQFRIIQDVSEAGYEHLKLRGKLSYQRKIQVSNPFGIDNITFKGYADWIDTEDEIGIDLKVKEKRIKEISLAEKCQMAAYSEYTGMDWEVLVLTPMGKEAKKEIILHDLFLGGCREPKEMAQAFKLTTTNGTTPAYCEKMINLFSQPDYKKPTNVNIFKVSESDKKIGMAWNEITAKGINSMIEKARKGNLMDDLLLQCIGDPEGLLVDPHERELIRETWGIDVQINEEEESGGEE